MKVPGQATQKMAVPQAAPIDPKYIAMAAAVMHEQGKQDG